MQVVSQEDSEESALLVGVGAGVLVATRIGALVPRQRERELVQMLTSQPSLRSSRMCSFAG